MAVRIVTTNPGKKTPGIDGIIWDTPNLLSCLRDSKRMASWTHKLLSYRSGYNEIIYFIKLYIFTQVTINDSKVV